MNTTSNKDFLGFETIPDFFTSIIGMKTPIVNTIGAIAAVISSFITDYMWDSYQAIYVLWFLMSCDWISGLAYAIKSKTYWSRKNFRMPIYFVVTSVLLSLSWHLAKGNVFFYPLPSVVYGGFCAVYLSSLVENTGKLGWLPKPLADAIANRFGLKELLKRKPTAAPEEEEADLDN